MHIHIVSVTYHIKESILNNFSFNHKTVTGLVYLVVYTICTDTDFEAYLVKAMLSSLENDK